MVTVRGVTAEFWEFLFLVENLWDSVLVPEGKLGSAYK